MKKVLSIVSVCLILACVLVPMFSVSAATPKEEIVAAAKELIPAKYHEEYLPILENVLQQVDVDATQAAAVIDDMKAAKAAIAEDKGDSLSDYSVAEQQAVLAEIKDACTTLGLTCEITPAEHPVHEGDVDFYIYNAGVKIADIDLDIKKTNTTVDYTMIVAAVALIAVAGGAFVYGKKLVASR